MTELPVRPLLAEARLVVIGVVTARHNNNIDDAHLLIHSYLQEAQKAGYRMTTAWSQLFAAATLLIVGLVECRASHHGEEVAETIQTLGMELASYQSNHG